MNRGQMIGNYRVERSIGEGSMGAVYEVRHERIGGRFAAKVLHPAWARNADVVRRFFEEAAAVNRIDDLGVVKVFDSGYLEDGQAYLLMEYLTGETLKGRLDREGRLLDGMAMRVGCQIAAILHAAHRCGVIHRDLKPANVMLIADREAEGRMRPKVLDFGIAKLVHDFPAERQAVETRTGVIMGTPAYMSPEQCRDSSRVDERTDVYSLGVMLYQMLTGRLPFSGPPHLLLQKHCEEAPPPLASLGIFSAGAVELIHAMLAKRPQERPGMQDVVEALDREHASCMQVLPRTRIVTPGEDTQSSEPPVGAGPGTGRSATQDPPAFAVEATTTATAPRPRWIAAVAVAGAALLLGGGFWAGKLGAAGPGLPASSGQTAQTTQPALPTPAQTTQPALPVQTAAPPIIPDLSASPPQPDLAAPRGSDPQRPHPSHRKRESIKPIKPPE